MDRLTLTPQELDYLRSQRLGRLATVDGRGAPQNDPVGFFIDEVTGRVLISGFNLVQSRKFRNLGANPNVAFVVDDLASVDPWTPPRGRDARAGRSPHRRRPAGARLQPGTHPHHPGLDRQLGPRARNVVPHDDTAGPELTRNRLPAAAGGPLPPGRDAASPGSSRGRRVMKVVRYRTRPSAVRCLTFRPGSGTGGAGVPCAGLAGFPYRWPLRPPPPRSPAAPWC